MAMNTNQLFEDSIKHEKEHEHEHDMVMPGFRFHPTDEELVEFYLRRKVEGKRFNVDLITFLDLYRYDPWELPALATIGEKEWYFYVPRDKKYRNGDRPNRVTTSGYWKATGADRMIRDENFRSIGLKKTLVFYSGKAPKGIRTSWIMNEYRLPQHNTQRLQKGEISLCRVHKRAGVDDHPSLSQTLPTKTPPTSSQTHPANEAMELFQGNNYNGCYQESPEGKMSESSPSSSTDIGTSLALSQQHNVYSVSPLAPMVATPEENNHRLIILQQSTIFPNDDLHKLVGAYNPNQASSINHQLGANNIPNLLSQFSTLGSLHANRLWDWNADLDGGKGNNNLFN